MSFSRFTLALLLILILSQFSSTAFAISEEERSFLLMYFKEEEIRVISATRSLKSIARVAENVEVVTKQDIELMNAHTLADVLNTVNGLSVAFSGAAPGSNAFVLSQGSRVDHVVIMVDGVIINDISGGTSDPSIVPVQMIEKVEVIKGPASSVWGSSLGGIVNVITKGTGTETAHGILSGSYGERNTGDFRGELAGRKGALGYYLFAGRLQSDGLRTHDSNSHNSIYSKLSYDFSSDTTATFTLLYNRAENDQGDFEADGLRFESKDEIMLSTLSLKSRVSSSFSIDVSGRVSHKLSSGTFADLIAETVTDSSLHDIRYGGSAKAEYRQSAHSVVFGADYDRLSTRASFLGDNNFFQNRAAVYANDTIAVGKLTVTPGLRFDSVDVKDTSLKENAVSPSLGVTFEIADKTILRGFVAKGFNVPGVAYLVVDSIYFVKNPDLKLEKVWSYQMGIETGALKYLWLKLSGFRHEIRDAIVAEDISVDEGTWTYVNKDRLRRQGFEVAIKSLPFYNLTFSAAATYINTKDLETDESDSFPQYTYDIGLQYDDGKTFRALLKGRYTWWNADGSSMAKYNAFVFDINAIKTVYKGPSYSAEVFVTAHNILNGSQYYISNYKNAPRWFEGGLRVKF